MAKKNFAKKKIQETQGGGFGKYDEANGGGTPIGGIYGHGHGRGIWKKAGSPGHRDSQPRTADGKFTYNSVNGKTISTNESRGKTVNPLLTGGENGIKIEDVEKQFSGESGTYWNKYKDKWYRKGGEIVLGDAKTRVSSDAIWEVAKRKYDIDKKEFEGESEVFGEVKKGRKTKEEKAATQKAQKSGKEKYVIDVASGGIKIKPGTQLAKNIQAKSQKPYTKITTPVAPVVPTTIVQQPTAQSTAQAPTSGGLAQNKSKFSDEILEEATKILTSNGISLDGLSVREIDEIIEQNFDFDEE